MFRAFNMGVGLVIACAPDAAERVLEIAAQAGEPKAVRLGRVVSGDRGVRYV
jgi:phosphoribosylaminoimidazole (AIR) synthetase